MTLYINACPREESRTERLARAYLAHISDVTELNVYDQPLVPLDRKRLAHRESLIADGKWHDPMFDYAHQFADADDIIIAAPYWDLGFPAQLKTYIENIYVTGIVSAYNDHGQSCGLCRARSLTYITTAGGAYDPRFSFDYLTAIATVSARPDLSMRSVSTSAATTPRLFCSPQSTKLKGALTDDRNL